MIFTGLHPLTGETLWGCPWKSSNTWFMEWYHPETFEQGQTDLTDEQLAWVLANPGEVAKLQAKVLNWIIPF